MTGKETKQINYNELIKQIPSRGYSNACGGYFSRKDMIHTEKASACHAWTNELPDTAHMVYGICSGNYFRGKEFQHFLEWLFNPKVSYYSQLIKYYGDDFRILRDKKDVIYGFYIKNFKNYTHNHQILHGIFKATRFTGEAEDRLKNFYKKWAVQEGYDPIIVWPLSYFFYKLEKSKIGHCSFDNPSFDLGHMVDINHGDWKIGHKVSAYRGEADEIIGSGFNPFECIKNKEYKPLKTRFYGKYHKQNVRDFTDEVFHEFFQEWDTDKYKEYH